MGGIRLGELMENPINKIKVKTLGELVAELQKYDQSLPMVEDRFTITVAKYHFNENGRYEGFHYGDGYGCCSRAKQLGHPEPIIAIRID